MRQCTICHGTKLMALDNNVYQRCDCTPPPAESDQAIYARRQAEGNAWLDAHPVAAPTTLTPGDWRDKLRDDDDGE